MIFYWTTQVFVTGLNILFSWLPTVTVLPLGIDSALSTAFGYWNGFLMVFWPLQIVWTLVLWYYGIKFALVALRLVIGSRVSI